MWVRVGPHNKWVRNGMVINENMMPESLPDFIARIVKP